MRVNISNAVSYIERNGAVLAFPIQGKESLPSLWSCFYPRSKMNWDWSESGDNRVAEIWHLRAALSDSRKVIYSKWYQGRATFFSKTTFTALLSVSAQDPKLPHSLATESRALLEVLEDDSPLPTKRLKAAADLFGKENEARFQRALRELWRKFLIVGYGEVEEGGFPSLAIGATRLLFEDVWEEARELTVAKRMHIFEKYFPPASAFGRFLLRSQKR